MYLIDLLDRKQDKAKIPKHILKARKRDIIAQNQKVIGPTQSIQLLVHLSGKKSKCCLLPPNDYEIEKIFQWTKSAIEESKTHWWTNQYVMDEKKNIFDQKLLQCLP